MTNLDRTSDGGFTADLKHEKGSLTVAGDSSGHIDGSIETKSGEELALKWWF